MARQLLAQRLAVVADHGDALALPALQAGDAHHEELVEIVGRDRQEAQALEDGMVGVARLLENPPIEVQPRQLAIDEPVRLVAQPLPAGGVEAGDLGFAEGGDLGRLLVHGSHAGIGAKYGFIAEI